MKSTLFDKNLLIALFSLWPAALVFSQEGYIKGKITNGLENLPHVTVAAKNKTIFTNIDGEFFLTLKPGIHQLIITYAGYKMIEDSINVKAGVTEKLNYQMRPTDQLGEVVVVGSRSLTQRTNLSSPVPIDVISSTQLKETGQISIPQMLTYSAPAINISREILNETATLRGLDPQHVLILVNGVRYHNMAWLFGRGLKGHLGPGSVGNDLNSIPFSAIDKIEILRDGAAAQYGSDAIAGVINVQLKKATGKTSVQLHTGQYYEGDGEKFSLGINHAISLSSKGYLNFSASIRYQNPTYRGGEYQGTVYRNFPLNSKREDSIRIEAIDDSIITARGYDRKSHLDNVGSSKQRSAGILVNGGYPISKHLESFWTIALNGRKMELENPYRYPKTPSMTNTVIFPDGHQPLGKPTTVDFTVMGGLTGTIKNNLNWNYTSSYGINSYTSRVIHAVNPSQSALGVHAQTSFNSGKDVYKLFTNDLNFSKQYSWLHLASGAEWRMENYITKAGEEASWKNYDTLNYASGGTGGARDPSAEVNKTRHVMGLYLELESEFSNKLLMSAATRYEYYSDYGGNIAAKLAARYKFSKRFMLRASVNNGFRAPSLQQRWQNSISSLYANSSQGRVSTIRGIFPNNHALLQALGIPILTPEKSINLSGGFTSQLARHISLSVDAYWIQIKNRIVLGGTMDKTIPAVKSILDNFPGIKVDQVQFFTNAINTNTKGLDLVLAGKWPVHQAKLGLSLAANFTSTELFGDIKTSAKLPADSLTTNKLFNTEDIEKLENEQPNDKIIFSVSYETEKAKLLIRNTRFGKTSIAPIFPVIGVKPESFSPKVITDISLSYNLNRVVTITAGINNLFDIYPDPLRNYENTVQGSRIYSAEASPFGFNGGYYYMNLAFSW